MLWNLIGCTACGADGAGHSLVQSLLYTHIVRSSHLLCGFSFHPFQSPLNCLYPAFCARWCLWELAVWFNRIANAAADWLIILGYIHLTRHFSSLSWIFCYTHLLYHYLIRLCPFSLLNLYCNPLACLPAAWPSWNLLSHPPHLLLSPYVASFSSLIQCWPQSWKVSPVRWVYAGMQLIWLVNERPSSSGTEQYEHRTTLLLSRGSCLRTATYFWSHL